MSQVQGIDMTKHSRNPIPDVVESSKCKHCTNKPTTNGLCYPHYLASRTPPMNYQLPPKKSTPEELRYAHKQWVRIKAERTERRQNCTWCGNLVYDREIHLHCQEIKEALVH